MKLKGWFVIAGILAVMAASGYAMEYDIPSMNGQSVMDVVVNILRTLMDLAVEFIGRVLDEIVRAATNFIHGSGGSGAYGNK